jgi:hypothetical protein
MTRRACGDQPGSEENPHSAPYCFHEKPGRDEFPADVSPWQRAGITVGPLAMLLLTVALEYEGALGDKVSLYFGSLVPLGDSAGLYSGTEIYGGLGFFPLASNLAPGGFWLGAGGLFSYSTIIRPALRSGRNDRPYVYRPWRRLYFVIRGWDASADGGFLLSLPEPRGTPEHGVCVLTPANRGRTRAR